MADYDFAGWATKNDVLCSDGTTIKPGCFDEQDGERVPLIWMHNHNDVGQVLGHALLQKRPEGMYAYGKFNDTPAGQYAKSLIKNGDVDSLSIFANHLKRAGKNLNDIVHGRIRELSLVIGGSDPTAKVDWVLEHGEEVEDEAIFSGFGEPYICHAEDEEDDEMDEDTKKKSPESKDDEGDTETVKDVFDTLTEKQKKAVAIIVGQIIKEQKDKKTSDSKEDDVKHADQKTAEEDDDSNSNETVEDVYNTLTEKQKKVVEFLVRKLMEEAKAKEKGEDTMKHNVFDGENNEAKDTRDTISHAEQGEILEMAKKPGMSLQSALAQYAEDKGIEHADTAEVVSGFDDKKAVYDNRTSLNLMFPDYKEVYPGAPELITSDQGWITRVLAKVKKSPISRVRTSQVDIREIDDLRAKGYQKGKRKTPAGNFSLIRRTTDPQTVYVMDALNRDDINDITDFDYVQYMYNIDRLMLNEEVATAIMIGDGRDDGAEGKVMPEHIRPIWTDDELYVKHIDLDIDAAKKELQGTGTATSFGTNFIYAEAIIEALLHGREENFRGTGTPDFYCTPALMNKMLLARDMNGRRIYATKTELQAALNIGEMITAEQFANRIRTDSEGKKHRLLGIVGNLADYQVGSTKGGEISHFSQFDIRFNQNLSLLETRLSGAVTRIYSFIVLEELVNETPGAGA